MKKMDSKGFTLVELLTVIVIIGIVAALSFNIVSNNIKKSKNNSYNLLIDDLKSNGKKYIMKESSDIDKYHLNTICISIEDLYNAGLIKNDKIKNPKTNKDLTGFIKVKFNSKKNQYDYTFVDNCTNKIINPIVETILNNEEIKVINNTDGLYETNDAYVYRGMNPNNYIRFNGSLWRIISIDKETNLTKIINLNGSQQNYQEDGMINYLNNDFEEGSTYYETKEMINTNSKWNSGKINNLDSSISLLSQEKQNNEFHTIGLLNISEYVDASLNTDCYKTNECNSYLSNSSNYYLYNTTDDNKIWYVGNDNKLYNIEPTTELLYNVYPTLYLNLNVSIISGEGTQLNPYEIQ